MAGASALPTPPGDAALVRDGARKLRRAEQTGRATASLRGRLAGVLPEVWSGVAAHAAVSESTELVRRCTVALDSLSAAVVALDRYAGAVDQVQQAVRGLQHEWDRAAEQHDRAVSAVRLRMGGDLDAARLLVRLTEDHDTVRARLANRHAEVVQELERAALRATAALAALNDEELPRRLEATPESLRDRLVEGLPVASGAARASDIRRLAVADAAALQRLRTGGRAAVTPSAVARLVRVLGQHSRDPLSAQALVAEIGVDGVNRLVVVLGDARDTIGVDLARQAVGALGVLLLTSAVPARNGRRDPRTARQLESAAALLRDDLVASLGKVVGDDATRSRATGYWAVGQLVVGARLSGWSVPLPPAFVGRLAAGAAAAEIGETRDDDVERVHGSTLARGAGRFASLFDDADVTGDALHTLLSEAGDDASAAAEVLSTSVEGHGLRSSRGGPLMLAEALARRWVTYEATTPSTRVDLELATNADLSRLMAAASGSSESGAALRARVMSEIGRLNPFAQQERSTIALYEANTAGIESAAVDWVLAMPEAIDLALGRVGEAGDSGSADGADGADATGATGGGGGAAWSVPVGEGYQPLLRVDELSGLIGAFAVGAGRPDGGTSPADPYQRLVAAEIARADVQRRGESPGRADPLLDRMATRLGFFEQAASAALVAVARRRDDANRSMWRALAEAKALALAWRQGPKALGAALVTLVSGGTNRTAEDDLTISLIRSDDELEQATLDERRTAALSTSIDALRSDAARGAVATAALVASGQGRGPLLATSDELRGARRQEQLDALALVVDERDRYAPSGPDRMPELDGLPRGKSAHTRLVESDAALRDLFTTLTRGAEPVSHGSYPGVGYRRSDGVLVFIRERSTSGGATIDIVLTNGATRKVHIR